MFKLYCSVQFQRLFVSHSHLVSVMYLNSILPDFNILSALTLSFHLKFSNDLNKYRKQRFSQQRINRTEEEKEKMRRFLFWNCIAYNSKHAYTPSFAYIVTSIHFVRLFEIGVYFALHVWFCIYDARCKCLMRKERK